MDVKLYDAVLWPLSQTIRSRVIGSSGHTYHEVDFCFRCSVTLDVLNPSSLVVIDLR